MNVLTGIQKDVKSMNDDRIWTRYLRLRNCGDIRHLYYTDHQLCRLELCASWAILGKGKKPRLPNWIFSFRINCSTENNNSATGWKNLSSNFFRLEMKIDFTSSLLLYSRALHVTIPVFPVNSGQLLSFSSSMSLKFLRCFFEGSRFFLSSVLSTTNHQCRQ